MSSIEKAVDKLRRERAEKQRVSKVDEKIVPASHMAADSLSGTGLNPASGQARYCPLDDEFLKANGFLTREIQDTVLAEEYRHIKRPLLMHIAGKGAELPEHANILMVTSALPGEGKTYTAMNLALSMAMEKNTTVLLVDSDVVSPALSSSLDLGDKPGLIDVLIDENITPADVIYKTSIPKLNLIPSGTIHSHSTELLASREMSSLIDELSRRYHDRVIILDAPPLLLTSHARVLADLAGQIIFVVEAGKTTHHQILEGVSQLGKNKIVGMVLNKSRRMHSGDYYYGLYGKHLVNAVDGE